MTQMRFLLLCGLALTLAGCPRNQTPRITSLVALPDSVTRSGVAQLSCAAEDPEGGAVSISWRAALGEVRPDTGSSPLYIAPNLNTEDTITVTVTDAAGKVAESSLVITVAEGLCGGRPEFLSSTYAWALAADSERVYYAQPTAGGFDLRWRVSGSGDSGVLFSGLGRPREMAYYAGRVWVLEGDTTGPAPASRIVGIDREGGAADTVVEFDSDGLVVTELAVSDDGVFFTWTREAGDTLGSGVSLVPFGGGPVDSLHSLWGFGPDSRFIADIAATNGVVAFIIVDPVLDQCEIYSFTLATREDSLLVPEDFIPPGRLNERDPLAIVGNSVYWGETGLGRLGCVGLDGSGLRYLLAAGGQAEGIARMVGADGPGGSGPRVFWSVPGDLRAMVVPSGDVLLDLDRGSGTVIAMCANDRFVFFTYDDGFVGRLYRVMIP